MADRPVIQHRQSFAISWNGTTHVANHDWPNSAGLALPRHHRNNRLHSRLLLHVLCHTLRGTVLTRPGALDHALSLQTFILRMKKPQDRNLVDSEISVTPNKCKCAPILGRTDDEAYDHLRPRP
jgi:hypothetical protein